MPPTALITGITGQDGSYLAEFLLDRGYNVYGLIRRSSAGPNLRNLNMVIHQVTLLQGDMTDSDSLKRAVDHSRPDEIYNLAAQSFVPMSWDSPTYTINVNLGGFTYLLEAVRSTALRGSQRRIKVYQASTSEMYGNSSLAPSEKGMVALNEESPMRPRSPYGISKLGSHRMAQVYRESFGMFVASGILFNHESPRRGPMFVTRKISKYVAQMYAGKSVGPLELGDLDAERDWGFAGDYVRAMWLMLQQKEADDYVIGTGVSTSVRELVVMAFDAAKALTGKGKGDDAIGDFVHSSDVLKRPAEIYNLRADASKAVKVLGWRPAVDLERLVHMMVEADLEAGGVETL